MPCFQQILFHLSFCSHNFPLLKDDTPKVNSLCWFKLKSLKKNKKKTSRMCYFPLPRRTCSQTAWRWKWKSQRSWNRGWWTTGTSSPGRSRFSEKLNKKNKQQNWPKQSGLPLWCRRGQGINLSYPSILLTVVSSAGQEERGNHPGGLCKP